MKIFVCLIKSIEVIWYELCSGTSVDKLSNKWLILNEFLLIIFFIHFFK